MGDTTHAFDPALLSIQDIEYAINPTSGTYWYRQPGGEWEQIGYLRYLWLRFDLDRGEQVARFD